MKRKQIKLLKALAFPATVAFMMGIGTVAVMAEDDGSVVGNEQSVLEAGETSANQEIAENSGVQTESSNEKNSSSISSSNESGKETKHTNNKNGSIVVKQEAVDDVQRNNQAVQNTTQVKKNYDVSDYEGLKNAVDDINHQNNGNYSITLKNNIAMESKQIFTKNQTMIYGEDYIFSPYLAGCGGGSFFEVQGNAILNFGDKEYKKTLTFNGTKKTGATNFITILNGGVLNVYNTTFQNNLTYGNGAGIIIEKSGTLNMYNSIIRACESMAGSAIIAQDNTNKEDTIISLHNVQLLNNKANQMGYGYGGAIYVNNVTLNLNNVTISENKAEKGHYYSLGGGIVAINTVVNINKAVFSNNHADTYGGAMFLQTCTLNIDGDLTVTNNTSDNAAGGIYFDTMTADLTKAIICNNTAKDTAADIYVDSKSSIQLPNAKNMKQIYAADQKGKTIDGWYMDEEDARYIPNTNGKAIDTAKSISGQPLVASYKEKVKAVIHVTGNEREFIYDGKEHQSDFTYAYEIDGKPVSELPEAVIVRVVYAKGINAGVYTSNQIEIDDSNSNYNVELDMLKDSKLTIHKRKVKITSHSAQKEYDGTPLVHHQVLVSGDGFVEGENIIYTHTGSQTEIGSSDNTFRYVFADGTNPDNYNIEVVYGTLTVTKPEEKKDENKKQEEKPLIEKISLEQEAKTENQNTAAPTSNDTGVQTGVEEQLGLYGLMAIASAVGLTAFTKKKREK